MEPQRRRPTAVGWLVGLALRRLPAFDGEVPRVSRPTLYTGSSEPTPLGALPPDSLGEGGITGYTGAAPTWC